MNLNRLAAGMALGLMIAPGMAAAQAETRLVPLGTGSVAAVYYPVGVALCRLVNQNRREHGLRCSARPSEGSVANIQALRAGTLDLAIVQSDTQSAAFDGSAAFEADGDFEDLRSVMSLYPEPLSIVAAAGSGVASLDDLAGKRVALGAPGSGQRLLMLRLMAEMGWTTADFASTAELESTDVAAALCADLIDAFVLVAGHPALAIREASNACDTTLAEADNAAVAALVADNTFYFPATIPGGLYRGSDRDIPTFGVGATLVTRADMPDDLIYTMVSSIFADIDMLRGLNPALAHLDPETMAGTGNTAPLHPGAERYYQEQGWLN